jgi:hypothetical protein
MEKSIIKLLLGYFVNAEKLTTLQLSQSEDYISGKLRTAPLIQDADMLEVLEYLKEISKENEFRTLHQLLHYFKNRKTQYAKFLWETMSDTSSNFKQGLIVDSFHGLTTSESCFRATKVYSNSYIQNFEQTLKAFIEKFSEYYRQVVGRTLRNNLSKMVAVNSQITAYRENCNAVWLCVDNFSAKRVCRYFEEFADNEKNGEYFVWKTITADHTKHCDAVITSNDLCDGDLQLISDCLSQRGENTEVHNLYGQIFEYLQQEQPFKDHTVKEEMVELLFYSKFSQFDKFQMYDVHRIHDIIPTLFVEQLTGKIHLSEKRNIVRKKQEYRDTLLLKQWKILKSPEGHSWLTSDNPGFAIHLSDLFDQTLTIPADPNLEFIREDTVIYFPLSSQYCLRIQPAQTDPVFIDYISSSAIEFEESSDEELEMVNRMTFSTKKEIVVAKNKKTLEQLALA